DFHVTGVQTCALPISFRIDSIMITTMIDAESNGTFAIALFIANVIAIPTDAIGQITSPILSQAFQDNNLAHIRMLYKRTSINLRSEEHTSELQSREKL